MRWFSSLGMSPHPMDWWLGVSMGSCDGSFSLAWSVPKKTFSPFKMLDWWDDWCTRAALNGSGGLSGSWIETLRENIIIIQMVPVFEIDSSTCWGLCKSIPVRVFSFFHIHILQIYTAVSYLNSTETTKTKFYRKIAERWFCKKKDVRFSIL